MRSGTLVRPLALALLVALALGNLLPLLGQTGPIMHAGAAPAQEVEPNNGMEIAMNVTPRVFYRAMADARSDPEDWFKMFVPRGKILNATTRTDDVNALNVDLEIYYDVSGRMDRRQWAWTRYQYETACTLSVADQYYFIKVLARSGSGSYTFDTDITETPVLTSGQTITGKALSNMSYDVIDYYKVWLVNSGAQADMLEAWLTKAPAAQAWITLEIQQLYSWSTGIRKLDISWEHPVEEYGRAVASETGWYYIRANCYNGSGTYNLTVKVTLAPTDGNDRPQDAMLLYGPKSKVTGSLDQSQDHRDAYAIYLEQGESVATTLELGFPFNDPTIFATTILQPDGLCVGEWTNYLDTGLGTSIEADMGHAAQTGRYVILVEAKVAVNLSHVEDLSDKNGQGNYTLTVVPSGHNSAPEATGVLPKISIGEDGQADLDLSVMFADADISQGDRLSYSVGAVKLFDGPAVKAPLNISLQGSGGHTAHIAPTANWSGSGVIAFQAKDIFGAGTSVSVPFTVAPANDAPVATGPVLQFDLGENVELRAVDLDTMFQDVDIEYGDQLSFRVDGNESLPAWVDSSNMLIIGPVLGFGQDQVFTVTATDQAGATAKVQVIVRVADVEHAPRSTTGSMTVIMNEDGMTRLMLYTIFSDPDPEDARLSFQWSANSKVALLLDDDGALTFKPDPDWWGTENVALKALDHTGKAARLGLTVRVDPVGDAPVMNWTSPPAGTAPSDTLHLNGTGVTHFGANVTDKDPEDAGRLVYIWYLDGNTVPGPANEPVLALDGTLLKDGNHTLELRVTDGYSLHTSAFWALSVERPVPPTVLVRPTQRQATTTGVAAVGLWAAVLVFASEPGRYSLFKFLWVPLYTKIRKEEVLDQFVRGRIFGFIEHNPGVTYSQIKRRIGVGNGTLTHHLSMLEKQNYIKAERDGLYKRFYPRDYHIDEDAIELSALQKDIYVLAKTRPGISQKDLSEELGVSERVVSYHIHQMQEARLIRVERSGRRNALFVQET